MLSRRIYVDKVGYLTYCTMNSTQRMMDRLAFLAAAVGTLVHTKSPVMIDGQLWESLIALINLTS